MSDTRCHLKYLELSLFIVLLVFFHTDLKGQYAVKDIPDSLMSKGIEAVIRKDFARYEMTSRSTATYFTQQVVTIFDKDASHFARFGEYYDNDKSVKIVAANVYDARGKRIYKLRKSDIVNQSAVSNISIYEDDRIKEIDLTRFDYPFTVEFEVEREYEYTYFIPDWYVVPSGRTAVEFSSVELIAPKDLMPRVKEFNIPEEAYSEVELGDKTMRKWTFERLKAPTKFYGGKTGLKHNPIIYFAPSKFEYSGYQGDMTNWDNYAEWINLLNDGKDDLSIEDQNKIRALVSGAETNREKVKILYEYLQNNTRYVSIQLGIGGFQPFPASYVSQNGYGDCKALSFYMKSLLNVVDIESNYTLVSAGANPRSIHKDFPFSNFNHAILMVPNKGDTLWLECTSQTAPFNYMGSFTGDREVFVIQKDGGAIVRTPSYGEQDNIEVNRLKITVDESGSATAQLQTSLAGLYSEKSGLNFRYYQSESNKRKWVLNNAPFRDFDLTSYHMKKDPDGSPKFLLNSAYNVKGYAKVSGKRVFMSVNPFSLKNNCLNKELSLIKEDDSYVIRKGFTKEDEITIAFPEKFAVDYVPESYSVENDFGSYHLKMDIEQGLLIINRKVVIKKQSLDKSQNEELARFLNQIIKMDDPKVVLKKAT